MFDDITSQRFMSKVDKDDPSGCWIWTGTRRGLRKTKLPGYGVFSVKNKGIPSHRYSYELHKGPIPDGLVLDHLCRVIACVNPDHLEPVTNKENILRGTAPTAENAKKTHCKHGHELAGKNISTRVRMFGNAQIVERCCLVCARRRKEEGNMRKARAALQPAEDCGEGSGS